MTVASGFEERHAQLVGSLQHQEGYFGLVETVSDAILVIEAIRLGILPRVRARLDEREREAIRAGSVFVYIEAESKIRRWTDGKLWSPSRVSGDFLLYREERNGGSSSPDGQTIPDGLIKRTITFNSRNANAGRRSSSSHCHDSFHLVSYSRESQRDLLQVFGPAHMLPALIDDFKKHRQRLLSLNPASAPAINFGELQISSGASASSRMRREMHDFTGHFRIESKAKLGPNNPLPSPASTSSPNSASAVEDEDQELFSHFLHSIHSSMASSSLSTSLVSSSNSPSGTASVLGAPSTAPANGTVLDSPLQMMILQNIDSQHPTSGMQLRTGKRLFPQSANPQLQLQQPLHSTSERPKVFIGAAGTLVLMDAGDDENAKSFGANFCGDEQAASAFHAFQHSVRQ